MTIEDIRRLGRILSIQADLEGMKANNLNCYINGATGLYPEKAFNEVAQELREATNKPDAQRKKKGFEDLTVEEDYILEAIMAARQVQEYLWGGFNCSSANFEEFKRMYRKRLVKLEEVDPANPHALVEAKKRILQIAAISINFLRKIEEGTLPVEPESPSNLPEYGKGVC